MKSAEIQLLEQLSAGTHELYALITRAEQMQETLNLLQSGIQRVSALQADAERMQQVMLANQQAMRQAEERAWDEFTSTPSLVEPGDISAVQEYTVETTRGETHITMRHPVGIRGFIRLKGTALIKTYSTHGVLPFSNALSVAMGLFANSLVLRHQSGAVVLRASGGRCIGLHPHSAHYSYGTTRATICTGRTSFRVNANVQAMRAFTIFTTPNMSGAYSHDWWMSIIVAGLQAADKMASRDDTRYVGDVVRVIRRRAGGCAATGEVDAGVRDWLRQLWDARHSS